MCWNSNIRWSQRQLNSATVDITNAFFSPSGSRVQNTIYLHLYTRNRLPLGKHRRAICRGLVQTVQEKGGALEHLQYINDIIVWGNTAEEIFEKEKNIIQIHLKAALVMKQSKVKRPAQVWQDSPPYHRTAYL